MIIRKIKKEELEDHQEKLNAVIWSQPTATNKRLDKISRVSSILMVSWCLNHFRKVQTDLRDIEDDVLDPEYVMNRLA